MSQTNIRERRAKRKRQIKSNDDLYENLNVDPTIKVEDVIVEIAKDDLVEQVTRKSRKRPIKNLEMADYDYQNMAVDYSKENTAQQLGNYRYSMDFLAHSKIIDDDKIVDRLKKIIYDYPNIDMSSFLNKENAQLYSWIIQHMTYSMGEKYLGSIYVLGGGIGLLSAMMLDSALRFENIRSFDINGSCQFLADELMAKELLADWKFKATTQDLFDVDYAKHKFICQLQDGRLSDPFNEVPGTIINTNISYLKNYKDWYNMLPELRRVIVVGETGDDVPNPFPSSQIFNRQFPMSFELYTGVLKVGDKHYFMKIGHK